MSFVVGPSFEGPEQEESQDVPRVGGGSSAGVGRSDRVGGRGVTDQAGEESKEGLPSVAEEAAVAGTIDPTKPMRRWRWVFGSVGLVGYSGRKAPSVVVDVHNQSGAEAPSSSGVSTGTVP